MYYRIYRQVETDQTAGAKWSYVLKSMHYWNNQPFIGQKFHDTISSTLSTTSLVEKKTNRIKHDLKDGEKRPGPKTNTKFKTKQKCSL